MDNHYPQPVDPPPALWQQPPSGGRLPPWFNRRNVLWCLGALFAAFAIWISWGSRETTAANLVPAACWFKAPAGREVACFHLQVPETRPISLAAGPEIDQPEGDQPEHAERVLALPVVVIYSTARWSAFRPDPVVYLSGGPGDGAWVDADRIDWWWDFIAGNDWLANRDLVLFDQRGSGMAAGDMDCPEAQENALAVLGAPSVAEADRLQLAETRRCAEGLLAAGHNAAAYTTVDNAADLHDLYLALEGPRWNVYGLSYGTRLALEYMRQHPGDIRSVILDSVLPPQVQFFEDDAANTNRAFQHLLDGCAADGDCRRFYPGLAQDLLALVQRLDETPLVRTIPHPAGKGEVTVRMDGSRLIFRLFGQLYNRDDISNLPRLIDAYARNIEPEIEADLENYVWEVYGRADFGDAMFLSVQCFEEMPFNDQAKAIAAYAEYPLLRGWTAAGEAQTYGDICAVWRDVLGAPAARPSDNMAVSSDLPTLILTGSYDPVTPPAYGALAAQSLSRSFLFQFPGLGHDVLGNDSCANEVAADFLAVPETRPNTACLRQQEPLGFYGPVN